MRSNELLLVVLLLLRFTPVSEREILHIGMEFPRLLKMREFWQLCFSWWQGKRISLFRAFRKFYIGNRSFSLGDYDFPIHPFFYLHLLLPEDHRSSRMELVDLFLERDRIIVLDFAHGVNGESAFQPYLFIFPDFSVHIGYGFRNNGKFGVVFRDVRFFKESVCFLPARDSRELHFGDEAFLERSVSPFHPPFRLRGIREDEFHSERSAHPPELRGNIRSFRMVLPVRGILVHIDGLGNSVAQEVFLPKRKHVRDSLVIAETSAGNLARRVVYRQEQAPLLLGKGIRKPDMIGSVELLHAPVTVPAFPEHERR